MLKGNFYLYTFFPFIYLILNFFVNFQCKFLSFLNIVLLSEFLIMFGMNNRSYSEIAGTFL